MCIGPAGENRSPCACITADVHHVQGRCGLGAVLGAMGIKAIVCPNYDGSVVVEDQEMFSVIASEIQQNILSQNEFIDALSKGGTIGAKIAWMDISMPYKNFQDLSLPKKMKEELDGDNFLQYAAGGSASCPECLIGCDVTMDITKGRFKHTTWTGVQANNLWNFGSKLGISQPDAIIKMAADSTDLGLDVDNTSGTISRRYLL